MKNLLIGLIIGSAIGGIWVQYRFSGSIWSNKIDNTEIIEVALRNKEKEEYEVFNRGNCFLRGKFNEGGYRICPMILKDNGELIPYKEVLTPQ